MNKKYFCLTLLVVLAIFWRFLLPGARVANDFPLISGETLQEGFSFPQTWTSLAAEGTGEYAVATLWTWPLVALNGLGAKLGLGFEVLEKLLGLIPILLIGAWSMGKLLASLGIKKWGTLIASLFYLTNTYILLVIDGGQIGIALAYAIFPLSYLAVIEAIGGGVQKRLVSGLFVALMGVFDLRFIYVLVLLLTLRFIWSFVVGGGSKIKLFSSWLKTALITGFVVLGLNAFWLFPSFLSKPPSLPATYQRVSQSTFLSFSEIQFSISALQPHWSKNVFGKITTLKAEFLLIPILVFLAPLFGVFDRRKTRKRLKKVGFWLIVALVGVFLTKGTNPPFPQIYPFLFSNIPGFFVFRDPVKFFFLTAISYSVLLGFTIDILENRLKWKYTIGRWKLRPISLLLIFYFVFLARPVWLGKMTGTFSKPYNKKEFFETAKTIKNSNNFARVLWIPSRSPLGYSSPTRPSLEASRVVQKRPFAIGTVGTYEVFNFLRESPFMGELFDISAIKYIAYPYPDERREELKPDNVEYYYAFLDQLGGKDWIEGKVSEPPVAVLETKKSQDHFFVSPNTFWVVGSDRIYWDLSESGVKFSDNALIFAEENPGALDRFERASNATVISYEKSPTDIAAGLIDQSKFIFPAALMDFDPTEEQKWPASNALPSNAGWWKRETADLIWWRNFLQQKYGIDNLDFDYGGGWAVGEGNTKYELRSKKLEEEKILLVRAMSSNKGGALEFFQGSKKIGEIDTLVEKPEKTEVKLSGYKEIPDQIFEYNKAEFSWIEVGELVSNELLTIKTEGEINVVNSLLVLPRDEWNEATSKVKQLADQGRILYWNDLEEEKIKSLFGASEKPTVSYERIDPTKYQVRVVGISKPVTLAFSETYDELWELDGQSSYPLYSLINGFYVEKDGEYEVFFTPQKYVYPGLVISGATLLVVLVTLFAAGKRSKRSQ